ncbi:hypothetical protein KY361_03930 [Candidatus Woesearchaeota archaeon]|nr:hypothetical protein [Candidatus Woesearchaeota archaeon]
MEKEILNKLGNIDEYEDFKEFCTIFINIRITNKLKKKGFKLENKFAGFRAS